jgi:superfamily II DNA or RNA helicase
MSLYLHQQELLEKSPDKYLFAWDCGTGKSRTSIELIEQKTFDVLVIVPKALVANWEREISKWSNGKTAYQIMTKERFRKYYKDIRRYDGIIVDEAHFFSGMSSQMSKALHQYVKACDTQYLYLLTATPFLSKPWNVYRLATILGHTWHYRQFEAEFFYSVRMGGRMIPMLKPKTEPILAEYVRRLGKPIRMDETGVDVPENNYVEEFFELNKKQKSFLAKSYDANPLVRFTREHQICGGTLKGDEFTNSEIFGVDKRERVLDLAEEHNKMIVVCRYNLEIEALQKALTDAGRKVYVITGQTKDRDGVLQSARNDSEGVLLVNASCSEGWEYPEVTLMVFYSYDFSLKNYIQMVGRIQRRNKLGKRTYLSLVTKSTIDEEVFNSILKKESFHIEIYAKQRLTK